MTARLLHTKDLAPNIRHFVFEVPAVDTLTFTPGQFASLTAEISRKQITRAYSLAAAPRGDNQFEICLNKVDDGQFSPMLFALQPGDTVELKGILGTFTWREPSQDAILVATGTGVVPFRAMLQQPSRRKVTLIQGARHESGLLYRSEFESIPDLQYIPTVTRPTETWTGQTGRVQPILQQVIGNRRDLQIYICGLKEMVDSVRAQCKEQGFDRRQLISEKYD